MDCTAYLAAGGFANDLKNELGRTEARHGQLLITSGPPRPAAWAANIWLDPQEIAIASISDAAVKLRAIQRNWAVYVPCLYRRAVLIQEQLPKVSAKPRVFESPPPAAPLGSWTLLDAGRMLAAPHCTSPFSNGEVHFVEDRTAPPQMGARVISVDKAPLAPAVERLGGIEHRQESAFALDPRTVGQVDWLFSDVVCYPARLLALVERWLAGGACRNFVCTVKFQGETDHDTSRRFAAVPGSQLRHLFHNKHELTWIKIG
jgi:23S rRNA (cytidine2498-2'-O)-methyltransferase